MDLKLSFASCMCCAQEFEINGVKADSSDFGEQYDNDPENAEEYGCGDMTFFAKQAESEVLKKYKISLEEYEEVAVKLTSGLSFGSCGLCS